MDDRFVVLLFCFVFTIGSNVGFRLNGLIPTPQSGSFPHVCVLACLQAQTDTGLDNYLHVMLDVRKPK